MLLQADVRWSELHFEITWNYQYPGKLIYSGRWWSGRYESFDAQRIPMSQLVSMKICKWILAQPCKTKAGLCLSLMVCACRWFLPVTQRRCSTARTKRFTNLREKLCTTGQRTKFRWRWLTWSVHFLLPDRRYSFPSDATVVSAYGHKSPIA